MNDNQAVVNQALVRRFFIELWNEEKLDLANELVGPEYQTVDLEDLPSQFRMSSGTVPVGPAFVRSQIQALHEMLQLKWDIVDMLADGARVVSLLKATGHHVKKWGPAEPQNPPRPLEYWAIAIHTVVDGKIVDGRVLSANLTRLQQVGLIDGWSRVLREVEKPAGGLVSEFAQSQLGASAIPFAFAIPEWLKKKEVFFDRNRPRCIDLAIRPPNSYQQVLDCGTGIGSLIKHVAPLIKYEAIVGIDVDLDLLNRAEKELESIPSVDLREGDIRDLPWKGETFDLVMTQEVLDHLVDKDREKAFREMCRVLKPGERCGVFEMQNPRLSFGRLTRWTPKSSATSRKWRTPPGQISIAAGSCGS